MKKLLASLFGIAVVGTAAWWLFARGSPAQPAPEAGADASGVPVSGLAFPRTPAAYSRTLSGKAAIRSPRVSFFFRSLP